MFANKRIRSDLTRVNYVLEALDEDGIRTLMDLLGADTSYDVFKQRLIATYTIPQSTRLQRIIQSGGMGDRTPSRLLRDMREVYLDGMTDSTLGALWLGKLPPAVRAVIAGLSGTTDFLAERADRVWEACADPKYLPSHAHAARTTSRGKSHQSMCRCQTHVSPRSKMRYTHLPHKPRPS